jgi:hypothetical protein
MSKIYHVFYYNAYDAMDCYGDFKEEELKRLLNQTGYDRVNINDLMVIEGRELSEEELKKIKE